jgi:hypothetical protein
VRVTIQGIQSGTPLKAIRTKVDAAHASRKAFATPTPQPPGNL